MFFRYVKILFFNITQVRKLGKVTFCTLFFISFFDIKISGASVENRSWRVYSKGEKL